MTAKTFEEWDNTRPFPTPEEAQEIIFEGHRCVVMDPESYEECFKQAKARAALLADRPEVAESIKWISKKMCHPDDRGNCKLAKVSCPCEADQAVIAALESLAAQLAQRDEEIAKMKAELAQLNRDVLEACNNILALKEPQ